MVSPVSGSPQAQPLNAVVFKQPAESIVAAEGITFEDKSQIQLKPKDVYGPPAPTSTGSADQEVKFLEDDPRFDTSNRTPEEKLSALRDNLRDALGNRGATVVEGFAGVGAVASSKKFNLSTDVEGIAPGAKLKFTATAKKMKIDDALRLNVPLNDRPRDYKAMVTLSVPLGGQPKD